jgi:putative NADH-flavin reductase
MKIVIFGATGGTGKNVVEVALKAGHEVIPVARNPEAVNQREHLHVHKGDVLDPASTAAALPGADAVICTIGPSANSNPGTLLSVGVKNIIDGCAKAGVPRLVFESGLICSDGRELGFLGSAAVRVFAMVYPKLKADKLIAEASIIGSNLDWVIVRPPALSHSPATGQYLAGPGARVMPAKALSHADCAAALLRAATEPAWVKQIVNVGRA